MAYRVIKTVKGKQYAYLQESYRVGNKVKTRSTYLGAVSGSGGGKGSGKSQKKQGGGKRESSPASSGAGGSGENAPQEEASPLNKVITTKNEGLRVRGDFSKSKVSVSALENKRKAFVRRMKAKGLNAQAMPQITLKKSLRSEPQGFRFNKRSQNISVFLPRGGNRSDFRKEVFRAFGKSSLEAMKKQKPKEFQELSLQFKKSHKASQGAISDYLKHTRGGVYKIWGLKFFGNAENLKKVVSDSGKLALVDFSTRKTWEDEALTIYSEMERVGVKKFRQIRVAEYAKAQTELKTATTLREKNRLISRKHFQAKKRLERANARLKTHEEMMKKADLVEKTFF